MGQTLPNGIYLPAEGERNCYDGLEGNWRSLDSLISTVAGKASATHTHGNITNDGKVGTTANLPLITGTGGAIQAGSFGNQANTFCEGNDSRLSDARTPVAHTHTKSDVTDLLNSDFIPSATNSYDLGSSSYQWKSVYAQSYYYNGTEFQNKFVTLDTPQTISANKDFTGEVRFRASNLYHIAEDPYNVLKSSTMQEGVVPSGDRTAYTGHWLDKDSSILGYDRFVFYSAGVQTYEVNLRNKATNGSFSPSGSRIQSGLQLALQSNGNSEFKIYAHTLPNGNGTWNLGDSTHKWKTLNGINPGALSLPDTYTNIDTTNWVLDGTSNHFVPTSDGWLGIQATDNVYDQMHYVFIGRTSGGSSYYQQNLALPVNALWDSKYHGCIFIPVVKNCNYDIRCICSTIVATFYPCQGNV